MRKILLMALIFLWMSPLAVYAAGITVAAAANLQFTLEDLKAEFTKETGINVKTVIASSGQLTAQAENGAPFDVFMSADMDYPDKLYQGGFTLQSPRVYAYGVLVLWTMKDLDLSQGMKVLKDAGIFAVAVADPKMAPYGREAVKALKFYDLYGALEKKLVFGENISQTNQFIVSGAADIGFTAKSAVLAQNTKDKGKWIEVDTQSYSPIAQSAVVLKYGEQNHMAEAHQFYDFLFSAPARAIFEKFGYNLP
jgi:molybdate transport system substrate-binding protein